MPSWTDNDVIPVRFIGFLLLAGLLGFTYFILRMVEVRQAIFEQTLTGMVGEPEDHIDFEHIREAFYQTEQKERPTLGFKHNLRIAVQALWTIAFSCHTSSILSISLVAILISCILIFFCLWRKQLRYPWMSVLAKNHLSATLLWIICLSTVSTTMITWSFLQTSKNYQDEETLEDMMKVYQVVGNFSLGLGGVLLLLWVDKKTRGKTQRDALLFDAYLQ